MKQTRFQEGPPPAQASRRRSSFAQSQTPEGGRPWEDPAPPEVGVHSSYRPNPNRGQRTYHGHGRNSSGGTSYTAPRGQQAGAPGSSGTALHYSNDGIRVYPGPEPDQPHAQIPPREAYTPTHAPRYPPPPMVDSFNLRSAPIRIPNRSSRPPPINTIFPNTPPSVPTPSHGHFVYGMGASNYQPIEPFESTRLSSDPRSSRESYSTDNSNDRSRRRNSLREENVQFPTGGRSFGVYRDESPQNPSRPHRLRRRSSIGQTFLSPTGSSSHSRNPSDEGIIFPAEDMPRRSGSLRGRDPNASYPFSSSHRRENVNTHQTAYDLQAATGMPGPGQEGGYSEAPLPQLWIAVSPP